MKYITIIPDISSSTEKAYYVPSAKRSNEGFWIPKSICKHYFKDDLTEASTKEELGGNGCIWEVYEAPSWFISKEHLWDKVQGCSI